MLSSLGKRRTLRKEVSDSSCRVPAADTERPCSRATIDARDHGDIAEPSIACAGEPYRWKVLCRLLEYNQHSYYSARVFASQAAPHVGIMPRLFGDKLRWLRQQRRMTQVDLARRSGLATQSHISYLEAGRSAPSLDLVIRIADIFEVTTDYLVYDAIAVDQPAHSSMPPHSAPTGLQHFGTKLRHLRSLLRMTQVDLAQRLAPVSQAYISFLESGRKAPSIDIVLQCAEVFGVSTDYLLRDTIPIDASQSTDRDPSA